MFTAKTVDGRIISLLHPETIPPTIPTCYCQECGAQLQFKKGRRRRPHFAHRAKSSCRLAMSEAESKLHEAGKQTLYQWLRKQGIQTEIEKYLPAQRQRPDILYEWKGKTYVLEFQCSAIPREKLRERTVAYQKGGIHPIWILPDQHLQYFRGSLYLQDWQKEAAHHFSLALTAPPRIYFLTENYALQIAEIFSYQSVKKNRAILWNSPLHTDTPDVFLTPSPQYFQRNVQAMLSYKWNCRYGRQIPPTPFSLKVQTQLLQYTSSLALHPAEAGWFLPFQTWIEQPPLLWQTWLWINIFAQMDCEVELPFSHFKEELSSLSQLLDIPNFRTQALFLQYIQLLDVFGIVSKGASSFKKLHPCMFPISIDQGYKQDQRYAAKWKGLFP